jgi:hypothetical protein
MASQTHEDALAGGSGPVTPLGLNFLCHFVLTRIVAFEYVLTRNTRRFNAA